MGGRAPRLTATRAAARPSPPASADSHSATVAEARVRCQVLSSNGGPVLGIGSAGPVQVALPSDVATVTPSDDAMPAAANQPSHWVALRRPGAADAGARTDTATGVGR